MISFRVHGVPKGQPRPRAFAFKGHARVYDAGTAEGWKSEIALAARPHLPTAPLEGALAIVIEVWMPRPAAHFIASKRERGRKAGSPIYHTSKPDADNLAKAILDALSTLRFWHDDNQVARLVVIKRYEDTADGPGAHICMEPIKGANNESNNFSPAADAAEKETPCP
jgi:Holliday junction resolvase RusA-like endonuclease